ncbi:PAS domain-containing protein [Niastella caeni]|uniref:histidine kinase n=1 Tax=Niastella caeni TaxID=2569763 RepID=A0A4S8HAK0_9BACT|nr:ATP-binding protein [Niastella caeni]THU30374.1 PAS domain-containing protein [Niastella caeni]
MRGETYQNTTLPNLYEMLNDCSIDRVMAIDDQWCVIAWNKTAVLVTGIDKTHIIGKPLLNVFPELQKDKEMIDAIQFAMKGNKSFLPARAGLLNRQSYENHFIPLTDEDGQVKGVMNIMHDVAHREKAEKKLQELNEALEQKYRQLETATTEMATFTYISSNEIKEPLRHVYTAFELLVKSEGKSLSNGGKANIRRIQASLNRMNLLLDDIWALSHINSFQQVRNTVDLNDIFRETLIKLSNKITEKEAIVTADNLGVVPGYKDMLQTLFVNIIDNGLKFQKPDNPPQVQVTSHLLQPNELPGSFQIKEPMVLLTFTDNGIGFDPAYADRVFIMFEKLHSSSHYSGSGMGLTIAKKIVEAHDGFIQATAHPGKGATIQCYLPVE